MAIRPLHVLNVSLEIHFKFQTGASVGCGLGCVEAACIPTAAATPGDACWVGGWGTLSSGGIQPFL